MCNFVTDSHSIHDSEIYQYFGPSVVITKSPNGYIFQGDETSFEFSIIEDTDTFAMISIERNSTRSYMRDCVQLKVSEMSWYGGPEQRRQYWPIEKLSFDGYSYVTKEEDSCAIAERYWLNSRGLFLYVDEETPLFLSQTANNLLCLYAEKYAPYYTQDRPNFTFNYKIGIAHDARQAHLKAVEHFLKKPSDYPDERMTTYPIWSTWAKYRRDINENVVLSYADLIQNNQFNNSQMDIDDMWETCYGSLEFNTTKFSNITSLTSAMKEKGFRVTLWVHPFINKGCEPFYSEALNKGYFVLNHDGNPDVSWWNSGGSLSAAHIDFTKTEAAEWYAARLRHLQTTSGVDSFKFDAGETSWAPSDPVLNATYEMHPNALTVSFVNTVVKFGSIIEVRTAHRQQNIPVYVRMLDKDSNWSWNNGLPTLVTTVTDNNSLSA